MGRRDQQLLRQSSLDRDTEIISRVRPPRYYVVILREERSDESKDPYACQTTCAHRHSLPERRANGEQRKAVPYISLLPSIAFCIVTSSAYSISLPTGTPVAMRVTFTVADLNNLER